MNRFRALIIGNGADQGKKNFIWNMIGSVIFAFASVVLFAAAQWTTGEYYAGIFSIAFTTGQQLLTIGYFEVRPFHATDTAGQYSFGEYLSARVITCGAMAVVSVLYVLVSQKTGIKAAVILMMCFYKLIDGAADVFEGEFHRIGRLDISGKSMGFRTLISGGVFIAAAAISGNIVTACAAACVAAVAAFFVFDIMVIGEFSRLKLSRSAGRVFGLLKDCSSLFVGSFLYLYICNAAKYAVDGAMSEEYVTFYTALYLPTSTINLFSGFVFKPLLTDMGNYVNSGSWKQFASVVRRLVAGVALLTAVCCAGAYLLGIPVLSLIFGLELSGYRMALVVLILGGGFNAAAMLLYYALTAMRSQRLVLAGYAAAAAAAFALSGMLVKMYGIMGAAACYSLSMGVLVLAFAVCIVYSYKKKAA